MAHMPQVCASPVGSITGITAPANVERGTATMKGDQGLGIEMQDAVTTMMGKVSITFRDDSMVEVNDHSRLEIDDFVFDASKPSVGKLALGFAQGTVRYASGAIAHNDPNKVDLQTPSATIAVRGTDFTATTDETGASTIILLPSCPKRWVDIDRDCKTGAIDVFNDAGSVSMNKPFQATKVQSRDVPPTQPVLLKLTTDSIDNLLIVSPPAEIRHAVDQARIAQLRNPLDLHFVDGNFLESLFVFVNSMIEQNKSHAGPPTTSTTATVTNLLMPSHAPAGNKTATSSPPFPPCLTDGSSNIQCVMIPRDQNTQIIQTQGNTSVINKINNGGNTTITLRQN